MNLPWCGPLLDADDLGVLVGRKLRGGAGVTVAVAIGSSACAVPQEGQNFALESICCPQAEQLMEEILATVPSAGHDTRGELRKLRRAWSTISQRRRTISWGDNQDNEPLC